jgi:hypothetical protein
MFTSDDDLNRADWPLLQNGAVTLFRDPVILAETRHALLQLDYGLAEISCAVGWPGIYEPFSSLLKWDEQFGYWPWTGNLDALNDGLRDYPFGPSALNALILSAFHILVAEDRDASHAILDMLEANARDHLLWGRTLIVLVQTDDSQYECTAIGGRSASWNGRERLNMGRS